jgi:hypothetical protein
MWLLRMDNINPQDGDARTCDRVLKGLNGLKKDGYRVERFEQWEHVESGLQPKLILIERLPGANDSAFEAWLYGKTEGESGC